MQACQTCEHAHTDVCARATLAHRGQAHPPCAAPSLTDARQDRRSTVPVRDLGRDLASDLMIWGAPDSLALSVTELRSGGCCRCALELAPKLCVPSSELFCRLPTLSQVTREPLASWLAAALAAAAAAGWPGCSTMSSTLAAGGWLGQAVGVCVSWVVGGLVNAGKDTRPKCGARILLRMLAPPAPP